MQVNYQKSSDLTLSHTHPLKQQCTKFLSRHQPGTAQQWLEKLLRSKYRHYQTDFYGDGPLVQELEARMADLLGKPNALFCHKGMVGQLSAIKHWTRKKDNDSIAFQPDCHMAFDEQSAYQELLQLDAKLIGSNQRPLSEDDFPLDADVSVVSIELPHRRAGFLLPEWQTLVKLKNDCQQTSTALHFDGARLFEAAPYWNKTPAEVATLSDSVYVSLYKMFGALAGGIVAADEDTISAIKPWRSRMGGDVHTMFPHVISAMMGLDSYLPRIPEFTEKAQHLSTIFSKVFGSDALPFKPQTNSFIVYLPLTPEQTTNKVLTIAQNEQKWLFDTVSEAPGGKSKVEIQIGDAIDTWSDAELQECLEHFLMLASNNLKK